MASEVRIILSELEKLEEEINELSIEFRATKNQQTKGQLIEKIEDNVKEARELLKQLEMDMNNRNNPVGKEWREKIKLMNSSLDGLKSNYITEEDDGIFENEANVAVRNQNGKLRDASKKLSDAHGYGVSTQAEMMRISDKLRGVKSKVIDSDCRPIP